MALPTVTKEQVIALLGEIGVEPGDGLLVHSALQFLGRPEDGPATYLQALEAVLGPEGTIAVPTFNFGFARGEDYDPATTPADGMGAFSEYVRQQPGAQRTSHPMQSLAILGRHAEELAALDRPSAFDDGSAFDRMLALDFKLLLLGASVNAASVLHYSEQRAAVPYRYWKDFTGRIRRDGDWAEHTYRMFVRDLERDPQLEISAIHKLLEERGQWHSRRLNYGDIVQCRLADFVAAADELLAADPWVFVTNRTAIQAGD
jgi:aminoglycoside N3'-acetyltransferase